MHRFFVPPESIGQSRVEFSPEQSRQIATVLRLRPGDEVAALDSAGWIYDVALTEIDPRLVIGQIRSRHLAPGEPRTKVTIYPSLLKSDKLEFVFQKCTEIGVAAFAPVISARCNVGEVSENKRQRWERIIAEAAEQSERGRLPQLYPVTLFAQACEQVRGLSMIAWERGDRHSLRAEIAARTGGTPNQRPFGINLFVGPEGGFTSEEIERAQAYGVIPVGLGPRVLRAETAAIVGATLLLAYVGDLE